jgi:hypothetical protein
MCCWGGGGYDRGGWLAHDRLASHQCANTVPNFACSMLVILLKNATYMSNKGVLKGGS